MLEFNAEEHAQSRFECSAHPTALRLLQNLTDDDVRLMSIEGDRGFDASMDFMPWRGANPNATLGAWLEATALKWDHPTVYSRQLLLETSIEAEIDRNHHERNGLDFTQAINVLDVTIISLAFAQIIVEGKLDRNAKGIVEMALERHLHPLVLGYYDLAAGEAERASLKRLLGFVDAASSSK